MDSKKVDFIYAYPLDAELRRSFEGREQVYPTREEIAEVMKHWRLLWQRTIDEFDVLTVLADVTKRVPKRNLECFIFGRGLTPKSTPFMIPIWNRNQEQWADEKFVDLMIHELLHVYLIENNKVYWQYVEKNYSTEESTVQNHVLLYSVLHKIYADLWQKAPMDFSRENLPPGYARSIELVKEHGPDKYLDEYYALI